MFTNTEKLAFLSEKNDDFDKLRIEKTLSWMFVTLIACGLT